MTCLLILGIVVVLAGAPSTGRSRLPHGPSWFDILPHLAATNTRRGRRRR